MVPKNYAGNVGAVLVAIQMGAEIGLSPMSAVQNIAVINGRPSLWGDAMLALVLQHRDCMDVIEDDLNDITKAGKATCIVKRRGRSPTTRTFSIEDAKKAGLWTKQGPWQQYPSRMLQMRARGFALRDAFPDALRGIHSAEEASDMIVDVTPASVGELTDGVHSFGFKKTEAEEKPPEPASKKEPEPEKKPEAKAATTKEKQPPKKDAAKAPPDEPPPPTDQENPWDKHLDK
jgi:hypothetical protein